MRKSCITTFNISKIAFSLINEISFLILVVER
jgi:hypothetical protein